ncbi:hypothetical protein GALMADRAFT_250501 [Galerina marginata CBS 339.88]|uniref:Uncharacterized protein n=1 Tax=Galerina marginata (strain CBS 339.88) TaxID=685588 RepID=A0A067T696_GALM3|nr:hypothetical protein GALMADRAFT_250501 [Galerina marginata CBS 339.88]
MQCTWQNLARLAFRDVARPRLLINPSFRHQQFRKNLGAWSSIHPFSRRLFTTAQTATSAQHVPPPPHKLEPGTLDPFNLESAASTAPLTPAALGRAASRAVRLLMQQGNLADAYLIVNSVRYAGLVHTSSSLPGIDSMERFREVALAFTNDVSPRLPSHTLLHGLIRQRMLDKASTLAGQMMASGMRVRCKTLDAIFLGLAQMSGAESNGTQAPPLTASVSEGIDILHLRPSMSSDTGTKFALRLLSLARQSRQRRSHNMFKTLMTLCIINGEIIIASLLFGFLLRDWQARELKKLDTPSTHETPLPVRNRMKEICTLVDQALATDQQDEYSQLEFKSSLQALANLAHLLDQRLIPFNNITPLLCSLYSCPRTLDQVWIPDKDGTPRQVEAYPYFHDVLVRLIHSLPTRNPVHDSDLPSYYGHMLPPLDRASYNTLLHYSLRHRHSAPLAEKVLHHMTKLLHEPIEPNSATMNIVERSGNLLRNSKITKLALSGLQGSNLSSVNSTGKHSKKLPSLINVARSGDNYALSTRISQLISTGQPQVVVRAIPSLLPGLTPLNPGKLSNLSPSTVAQLQEQHRQEGLQHAVSLGPVVLTSILNALQKTGRTGLAEKVWLWAKEAEALSWKPDNDGVVKPWCLPVIAYTVMIKVYASEAKKGRSSLQQAASTSGKPSDQKSVVVAGWGRLKDGRKMRHDRAKFRKTRSQLGREMGLQMYRSLWPAADTVAKNISELQSQGRDVRVARRQLEIPRPDPRFFKAVLDIVGRQPCMTPRRMKRSKAHYSRLVRNTKSKYIWRGVLPRVVPDPALLEVAKDMAAEGVPVPLLYQRLLVGRWEKAGEAPSHRVALRDRRPFAVAISIRRCKYHKGFDGARRGLSVDEK